MKKIRPFFALLRTSFLRLLLSVFNIGGNTKKRKKASTGVAAFIFMAVLMLFISGSYSFSLAFAFAPLGGLDIMLAGIAFMALLLPFIFTVFSAQSIIFSPSDMDLSFSLPVSSFSIMLSRVLALYIEILLITELLLLPAAVAYVWFGGSLGALFGIVIGGAFWAIIPAGLGLIFGCLISLVISKLKYKNLFTTLFSLLVFAAIFIGSGNLAQFDAAADPNAMADLAPFRVVLFSIFPPVRWLVQGATTQSPLLLLLLALVCTLPFLLVTWLFSRFYKPLLTMLASHKLQSNFKLREVATSSRFGALLKKEAGRLFGNSAYLLNSCIGILMMVVATGYLVVQGNSLLAGLANMGLPVELIDGYIPAIITAVCVCVGIMCVPAACSISLEGQQLWVLKTAPVDSMQIFLAKAALNALIVGAGALLCGVALGIAFGVAPLPLLAGLLVGLLFAVLVGLLGVFINLLLPKLNWVHEIAAIKQSASPLVAMLANLVFAALLAGLYFLMHGAGLSFSLFCLAACVLLAGVSLGLYALLRTKGRRIFYML